MRVVSSGKGGFGGYDGASAFVRIQVPAAELPGFLNEHGFGRVSDPERGRGVHFTTYVYPDLGLVEKVPHSPYTLASVHLAEERLGGLTVPFAVVEDEGRKRIFMEKYVRLSTTVGERIALGDVGGAERMLRGLFEVNHAIIRRGVVNWDPTIENHAHKPPASASLIDLGGLVDAREFLEEGNVEDSAFSYLHFRFSVGVPKELLACYLALRDEFGLAHGGAIVKTVKENMYADPPRKVEWEPTLTIPKPLAEKIVRR